MGAEQTRRSQNCKMKSRGDDECHIGNLPNEVLEKILEIVFVSSAILSAGNACHIYQLS